jgi:hypothetical protein
MNALFLLLVLSLVTYRVGRFIALDTLIDVPRLRLMSWLAEKGAVGHKLNELLGCAYCITIWVSAAATALTMVFMPVPMPVWMWLAASAGALVVWAIVDSE